MQEISMHNYFYGLKIKEFGQLVFLRLPAEKLLETVEDVEVWADCF